MIKVAGYCRVSTDQADQHNSFLSQQQYFRQYIESHPDWQLHEIYADEGITGTTTKKRVAFNRMIQDAYEGKFHLILTKEVSRFSRNILDTIAYTRQLKQIGIGVIFLTDRIHTLVPEAEMLLSYLASMAQEESRRTSARVVWGQTRQMEKGVVFGRSLLGYQVKNGNVTLEPEGAEIVRLIFHKYALEQWSTTQIARFLTTHGYLTQRGNPKWHTGTVAKILRNEKYVGDLIQRKSFTPDFLTHEKRKNRGEVPLVTLKDHHMPIVSRELWDLAQKRLAACDKHSSGHSNRYLFSGKIRCGQCGSMFVGRFRYRSDGSKYRRWSCCAATTAGRQVCDIGKLIRDDDALQMLKTAIGSLTMDTQAVIRSVTALALEAIQQSAAATEADPHCLRSEIGQVEKKKQLVLDSYFSQDISREDMLSMVATYQQQLQRLQQSLEAAEQTLRAAKSADKLRSGIAETAIGILSGQIESQIFYKTILEGMTVCKDRQVELRLQELSHLFVFGEETRFDTTAAL